MKQNLRLIKKFGTTDFVVSAQSNDFTDYTDKDHSGFRFVFTARSGF